ncbi:MAG: hypothetical protein U1D66_15555 [Erythrobacter sp.]|nr:hypothetical protein [Erythrobacter sp.]
MAKEETQAQSELEGISLAHLKALDANALLAGNDGSDHFALTKRLREAQAEAKEAGHEERLKALGLLHDLLNIHLRVHDRAEPFGPMFQGPEGRTCTASDFRGDQSDIFAEFAAIVEHPVLKARLADLAWYNDRKRGDVGKLAVEAYCEIIKRRLAGELHRTHGDDAHLLDMADIATRMMTVAARVHKINALPPSITDVIDALFYACIDARSYVAFCHVAEIVLGYDIADWEKILKGVEAIVADTECQDYPMAIQGVWELAERGYAKLNDKDNQKRAQDAIVEQDLKMRSQVGQASAEAHWVRVAIDKLRRFGGNRERIAQLRKELRELEEASLDDFYGIPCKLDISELTSGTVALFKTLTLPDMLLQFAVLSQPQSKEALKRKVDESSEKFVMSSLFAGSHADREGKVYAQTDAKPADDADKTDWYKAQSLLACEMHRQLVVGGLINPARRVVMGTFPLEERHFLPIVYNSPFVENGYHHTFSLGFARLFQGDFISAANILIPQLENSIRYVLKNTNAHSAKLMSDLTQDDRSLSSLLDHMREEMEGVFGVDLVHEIDLLFNYRPGPALRHEAAHGKLTDSLSYSADAIYACWLIYQITVAPLLPYWKEHIAPQIEMQAF